MKNLYYFLKNEDFYSDGEGLKNENADDNVYYVKTIVQTKKIDGFNCQKIFTAIREFFVKIKLFFLNIFRYNNKSIKVAEEGANQALYIGDVKKTVELTAKDMYKSRNSICNICAIFQRFTQILSNLHSYAAKKNSLINDERQFVNSSKKISELLHDIALDVHGSKKLNDVEFKSWLKKIVISVDSLVCSTSNAMTSINYYGISTKTEGKIQTKIKKILSDNKTKKMNIAKDIKQICNAFEDLLPFDLRLALEHISNEQLRAKIFADLSELIRISQDATRSLGYNKDVPSVISAPKINYVSKGQIVD